MLDKTIIYSIIYTIIILLIDRTKITKKYKFEPLKLFNYCMWTCLSLFVYIYPKHRWEIVKFCSSTVVTNFTYETIYYPEDFWHNFHHYMTILAIIFTYSTCAKQYYILECINIYYVAFISSIVSSLRKITKIKYGLDDIKTTIIYHVYRISYLLAKGWGLVVHYKSVYNNIYNFNLYENISVILTVLIHLIQIFFISKIIK